MLYVFQAVFPPIIRSSKHCIYSIGYCEAFLLLTASVGEFQLTHASVIFILLSVLYMFQAVFPPIIRSSKNCIYSTPNAVYTVL